MHMKNIETSVIKTPTSTKVLAIPFFFYQYIPLWLTFQILKDKPNPKIKWKLT